jgi:hypothetical protein
MLSVAQSLGIEMPSVLEARMTLVPSGTETSKPSMVRVTVLSETRAGVPKSRSREGARRDRG